MAVTWRNAWSWPAANCPTDTIVDRESPWLWAREEHAEDASRLREVGAEIRGLP